MAIPGLLTTLLGLGFKRVARRVLSNFPPGLQRAIHSALRVKPNVRRSRVRAAVKRPVPLWSLFFILLLGSGFGVAAYAGFQQMTDSLSPADIPDYTIAAAPAAVSFSQGSLATFTVHMVSLAGFAGSVSLSAMVSSSGAGFSTAVNPVTVSLFPGTGSSQVTVSTSPATAVGTYTLTVNGTSGRLSHTVVVFLTVTPPPAPDFSLSATPSSLSITAGSSGFATVLVTSINGFSGNVSLTASVSPSLGNGPTVALNPATVALSSGATQGSSLVIATVGNTPKATYTILVVARAGSIYHSVAIALLVQ